MEKVTEIIDKVEDILIEVESEEIHLMLKV